MSLRLLPAALACLSLSGCALWPLGAREAPPPPPVTEAAAPAPALRPPAGRTAAALDTTTPEERAAAVAPAAAAARLLGTTLASLGDPAAPGFWMATPLVTAPAPGQVRHPASGATVRLELRPSGAAPGAGSQLSLAAFRALELPLTALPELEVRAE
jgi:hypothetical protein